MLTIRAHSVEGTVSFHGNVQKHITLISFNIFNIK